MKRPSVLVVSTADDLVVGACSLVARAEKEALERRGEFRVVLAAGGAVERVLQRVAATRGLRPDRWRLFAAGATWPASWRDGTPPGPCRDGGLPDRAGLRVQGVHGFDLAAGSPERAALLHQAAIRRLAPAGDGSPRFDLVLLELSGDGGVAGLAPASSALVAAPDELAVASWDPARSTWSVTMTAPALSSASRVVVLALGADRAGVLSRVLDGDGGSPAPASRLRPPRGSMTFLADDAAAAQLKKLEAVASG